MSEKELNIKCRLCEKFHEYIYRPDKFNALTAAWREIDGSSFSKNFIPTIGAEYFLTFSNSLKLNLNEPFWVFFQSSVSFENGIETVKDIMDLRFCKCTFLKIIQQNEGSAILKVRIEEIKSLDALPTEFRPDITWWTLFTDHNHYVKYGRTDNFKDYAIITINVQGDLGIQLIVKKEVSSERIVAVKDWDFHHEEWNLCSIQMTRKEAGIFRLEI